jgi:hypothetical protein
MPRNLIPWNFDFSLQNDSKSQFIRQAAKGDIASESQSKYHRCHSYPFYGQHGM